MSSFFKWKDKAKDKEKDPISTDPKAAKPKKVKAHDIWEAAAIGNLEAMDKVMKKKGGLASINAPNDEGLSPIHIAAEHGHVALVEYLLENGAHCNMIENTEERWNVLHRAVHSRNFAMMKLVASQPSLKRTL